MKKLTILLSFYLMCAWAMNAQTYSGGSGTQASPYLISTKADMIALSDAVYGGTSYYGEYFLLTNDLIGSNTVTTSVGFYDNSNPGNRHAFSGVFDGGGHEMEVNNAYGVFGYLGSATVKNLGVKGTVSASVTGNNHVGGICGYAYSSTISHCYNLATVASSSSLTSASASSSYAGGICGYVNNIYTIISNCYNLGNILSSGPNTALAGGICGYSGTISNCYNSGNISSSGSNNYSYAGGICGSSGTISNCYNSGNISSSGSSKDAFAGGICGSQGTISSCYNLGNISSSAPRMPIAGGICGSSGSISSCFAANSTINGSYAGRIVGTKNTVNNCYALSTMTINGSVVSSTDVYEKHGGGETISSFQSQSWIETNLAWDFNVVWKMTSSGSVNYGLPIFKNQQEQIQTYTITTQSGTGISATTGAGTYNSGATATVGCTVTSGYTFDGWYEGSTKVSSSQSYSFTVTATRTLQARAIRTYTITTQSGTGVSATTGAGTYNSGATATVGCTVTSGYTFDGWYEGSTKVSSSQSYSFTVTAARTLQARAIQTYTITTSAGTGISATTAAGTYNSGTTATIGCTVTSGYTFDGWYEGSTKVSSSQSYSFTVTAARTLQARAIQTVYTITVSTGANGSISPSTNQTITHGGNQTFTFTPNTGYEINQVLIDGTNNATAVSVGSYTFTSVTANHTISVSFKQKQYTITVSTGVNGSISPSTNQTITHGGSQTFTFTPNTGYEISQMFVDGVNTATAVATGSYTFTNVTANHTISVSFIQKATPTFSISASASANGSISPSDNVIVSQGGSQTFIFTPNTGYEINQVLIDDVNDATAVSTGNYTFQNITAEHTISVSFKQKQHTITVSAGSGGKISPSGNITVSHGGEQRFVFTPDADYEIANVWIDGVDTVAAGYTFTNIVAPHTITVSFKQRAAQTCTITASAGNGGNISPSGNVNIGEGGSQTFHFTPDTGYEINQVFVDGVNNASAAANGTHTFANVTTNHTIAVTFRQKQYTITVKAGAGGSISPASNQTVNYGYSSSFDFVPNRGYEIEQVLVDGVNNAGAVAARGYTFWDVVANHSIAVTFKPSCRPNLVVQVWDNVLSVVNQPTNNGGYRFESYQWQRNGVDMAGATRDYLYFGTTKDYTSEYSVRLTTSDGQSLLSCPMRLQAVNTTALRSYPNPTTGIVTVEDATIQANTKIDIYNINGQLVKRCAATQNRTTLDISSLPRGTYIVRVNNRQGKIIKN